MLAIVGIEYLNAEQYKGSSHSSKDSAFYSTSNFRYPHGQTRPFKPQTFSKNI